MAGTGGKKLSTAAAKELRDLQQASVGESGFVPARRTGEERGGVKDASTKSATAKRSVEEAAKKEQNQEKERKLKELRAQKLGIPKSGSKSEGASPALRLGQLPGGVSPETYTKQLLGQAPGVIVLGRSLGSQAASTEQRHLPAEAFKKVEKNKPTMGAGTPPQRTKSDGPELDPTMSPRNLFKEMDVEGQNSSFSAENAPVKEPSNAEVMAAVKALTSKFEQLATKEDLHSFKAEIKEQVKEEVKEAVKPVQAEVKELNKRVGKLETSKGGGKGGGKDLLDPAPKRVEFKKFKSETTANQRLDAMKAFCARYPGPAPLAYGNNYTGPYTKRELKDSSYAEFADQDAARVFMENADKVVEVAGAAVEVRKAKTKFAKSRDWAFYTAKDKLKEAAPGKTVEVKTDKGQRTVTVDSVVAFLQEKTEERGTFEGEFAHLSLPA